MNSAPFGFSFIATQRLPQHQTQTLPRSLALDDSCRNFNEVCRKASFKEQSLVLADSWSKLWETRLSLCILDHKILLFDSKTHKLREDLVLQITEDFAFSSSDFIHDRNTAKICDGQKTVFFHMVNQAFVEDFAERLSVECERIVTLLRAKRTRALCQRHFGPSGMPKIGQLLPPANANAYSYIDDDHRFIVRHAGSSRNCQLTQHDAFPRQIYVENAVDFIIPAKRKSFLHSRSSPCTSGIVEKEVSPYATSEPQEFTSLERAMSFHLYLQPNQHTGSLANETPAPTVPLSPHYDSIAYSCPEERLALIHQLSKPPAVPATRPRQLTLPVSSDGLISKSFAESLSASLQDRALVPPSSATNSPAAPSKMNPNRDRSKSHNTNHGSTSIATTPSPLALSSSENKIQSMAGIIKPKTSRGLSDSAASNESPLSETFGKPRPAIKPRSLVKPFMQSEKPKIEASIRPQHDSTTLLEAPAKPAPVAPTKTPRISKQSLHRTFEATPEVEEELYMHIVMPSQASEASVMPSYFKSSLSVEEQSELRKQPEGTFIVRNSKSSPSSYTLVVVAADELCKIAMINENSRLRLQNKPEEFATLVELVDYYQKHEISLLHPPTNTPLSIRLKTPYSVST